MNVAPETTLVPETRKFTIGQSIMNEMMRNGPSFIMIGLAVNMDHREVKKAIKDDPNLHAAYKSLIGQIALSIREKNGNKTSVAEVFNVPRHVVEQWERENPRLRTEFNNASESMVDLAESKIYKAVENDQPWAVLHVLETKGASRGWVKKRQIDLHSYADQTGADVRLIIGDVVAAIGDGRIDTASIQPDD